MKYNYLLIAPLLLSLSSCSDEYSEDAQSSTNQIKIPVCQSVVSNGGSRLKAWCKFGETGPFLGRKTFYYRFTGSSNVSTTDERKRKTFDLQLRKWEDVCGVKFVNVTGTNTPCQFSVNVTEINENYDFSEVVTEIGKANESKEKELISNGVYQTGTLNVYNIANWCGDANGQRAEWEQPMLHAIGHVLGLQHETENPNQVGKSYNGIFAASSYDASSVMKSSDAYKYVNGEVLVPMPSATDKAFLETLYPKKDTCYIWNMIENGKNIYVNNLSEKSSILTIYSLKGSIGRCLSNQVSGSVMLYSYYNENKESYELTIYKKRSARQLSGYSQEKEIGYIFPLNKRVEGTTMLYSYSSTSGKHLYSTTSQSKMTYNNETYNIAGPIGYVFND